MDWRARLSAYPKIISAVLLILGTEVVDRVIKLFWKFTEHMALGWTQGQLAKVLGITSSPTATQIFDVAWPLLLAGIILWSFERFYLRPKLVKPIVKSLAPSSAVVAPTTSTPIPDWTIRELFFHIRPDLVDNHKDHAWKNVSLDIRDKLSTGIFKIWGRLDASERMPLSEISQDYWQHAEFTYFFLSNEEGARYLVHATPRIHRQHAGLPQYRDLQVNKAQALVLWPNPVFDAELKKIEFPDSLSLSDLGQAMVDTGWQVNSFIEHESNNRSEEQIVNYYHTAFAPHVISLYEAAKRKGFSPDPDIERYYQNPKSVENVRHVGQRIGAMGLQIRRYV